MDILHHFIFIQGYLPRLCNYFVFLFAIRMMVSFIRIELLYISVRQISCLGVLDVIICFSNVIYVFLLYIYIQRTLVITTAFVPKDSALMFLEH